MDIPDYSTLQNLSDTSYMYMDLNTGNYCTKLSNLNNNNKIYIRVSWHSAQLFVSRCSKILTKYPVLVV